MNAVLLICAAADAPLVRGLALRLHAEGMVATLSSDMLAQPGSPRLIREALHATALVVVCLSQRALPNGSLDQDLARLLDLLAVLPNPRRLLITLRLTTCTLPEPLRAAPSLDLFNAQGYAALLATLRSHAATLEALKPPPVVEPAPLAPQPPALTLRGGFASPELERQGLVRRLGRGVARAVWFVDAAHALVVSGGGPALVPLAGGPPLWAIDCPTTCAALSPDQRWLVLSQAHHLLLWDLSDGHLQHSWSDPAPVQALGFAPDGRTLASVGVDRRVRLWRISSPASPPTLLATLTDEADQLARVAFSPDGNLIATGGIDQTVRVWRMLDRTLVQTLNGLGGAVEALAFSPDGQTLAAATRARLAYLWATQTWQPLATLAGHQGAIECMAFSADSQWLATGATDQQIRLWRRTDGTQAGPLLGARGPVTRLAFSPDCTALVSVGEEEHLRVWQLADHTQTVALRVLSGPVTSVALSADSAVLAIGLQNGATVIERLREPTAPRLRQHEHTAPVLSLAFTPATCLLTAAADRTVRLCQPATGAGSVLLQTQGASQLVALAPDGRLLAKSDGAGTVQLWRLRDSSGDPCGEFWGVLRGMRARPHLMAFGPCAQRLALADDAGGVWFWHLRPQIEAQPEPNLHLQLAGGRARCLALSADGSMLAAGNAQGDLTLWRTVDGTVTLHMPGTGAAATSAVFSPDGRMLVVGDAFGRIHLWRLTGSPRRRQPTSLHAHAGTVTQLQVSAQGTLLISGSDDGTVRMWKI